MKCFKRFLSIFNFNIYFEYLQEYARLRALGEEKVAMAERMQELVEKYVQF